MKNIFYSVDDYLFEKIIKPVISLFEFFTPKEDVSNLKLKIENKDLLIVCHANDEIFIGNILQRTTFENSGMAIINFVTEEELEYLKLRWGDDWPIEIQKIRSMYLFMKKEN